MRLLIILFIFTFALNSYASESYKESLMPPFASTVLDRDGEVIGYFFKDQFRLYSPIKEIPKNLILAVISIEDDRFFEHRGVDPIGLLRAAITDIKSGKIVQGGSTITQQLAKLIFLSPERSFERKFKEMAIARELEKKLTKMEILELYLNYIYLGNGAYGVKAASRVMFGKDPYRLSLSQCALIAGLIKGPEYYNPFKHPERALKRRNLVLYKMYKNGFISKSDYESAKSEPLGVLEYPNFPRVAGYDLDFVKFNLKKVISNKKIFKDGLVIRTTLDSEIQQFAQEILRKYNKSYKETYSVPDIQCAGMAVSKRGEVIFVVGGDNYTETKLNRAFQVLRPIGSTAKPFTYLAAFSAGLSPYDYTSNVPFEMPMESSENGSENNTWVPENYSHKYSKYMELKYALEHSVNVATLHVAMDNLSAVKRNLRRFKLIGDYFDLSYVLGSFPSNLYRIVRAYSAFQNGGLMYEPYVIEEIRDRRGRLIYRGYPVFERVADRDAVNILRSVLQDVVKEGTARRISYLAKMFDLAGKTGTTNDWRDVYFTGFTTSFTMSVWFGRDSYKTLWKGAVGGSVAAPVWAEIAVKVCSKYGCGKFVPSYEDIVSSYPEPLKIPGNGDRYLMAVNFIDNSYLSSYIDFKASLNRSLSSSDSK